MNANLRKALENGNGIAILREKLLIASLEISIEGTPSVHCMK